MTQNFLSAKRPFDFAQDKLRRAVLSEACNAESKGQDDTTKNTAPLSREVTLAQLVEHDREQYYGTEQHFLQI